MDFSIDPGMTGALLFRDHGFTPVKMPVIKVKTGRKSYRSELDINSLVQLLRHYNPTGAPETRSPRATGSAARVFGLLERQSPHRGQGFFGNASIMQSYGVLQGALHALSVPFSTIDPQSWRKAMRLPPAKERSWLLLGREHPDLAAMVSDWTVQHRIAVADCYCMLVAAERLRMIKPERKRPEQDTSWLE